MQSSADDAPSRDTDSTQYLESRALYANYFSSLARGVFFLAKPSHIATFVGAWAVLALRELMSSIIGLVPCCMVAIGGLMLWGAITGWYQAFKLNLVVWAADDNDDLPPVKGDGDWLDGVILPLWRMVATYIVALLPACIYIFILGAKLSAAAAGSLTPGVPVPSPLSLLILAVLLLVGSFIWPMLVLVVSCGGSVWGMFRLDLISETIRASFPAYLLTVLAVWITFGLKMVLVGIVVAGFSKATNSRSDWLGSFLLPAFLAGVALYFDMFTMRAIGFYYRCFKEKFAWSWG